MDVDTTSLLSCEVDKTQIPPLDQKRILAFVNHFLLTTCTFLNDFATKCEYKFIEVERKLQKVEASLIIIEEKLASIPGLEETILIPTSTNPVNTSNTENPANNIENLSENISNLQINAETTQKSTEEVIDELQPVQGVKASDDLRYRKYFKMIQFGVPGPAVKMKMESEQLDPNILDNPNQILPDGIAFQPNEE